MDEILLFLTLKYNGQWISIYNSLQNREKILIDDIKDIYNRIDCDYITIIDNNYPDNLKQIYKPPFGLFYYGNFKESISKNTCLSVIGDINLTNIPYLLAIKNNGVDFAWYQPHKKQLENILNLSSNNIFYCDDLNNSHAKNIKFELSKLFNGFDSNLIISEIYNKNLSVDYSEQFNKRIFVGLNKAILIINKVENNTLGQLIDFCKDEGCKVYILKDVANEIVKYYDSYIELNIINDFNDINIFFDSKN